MKVLEEMSTCEDESLVEIEHAQEFLVVSQTLVWGTSL